MISDDRLEKSPSTIYQSSTLGSDESNENSSGEVLKFKFLFISAVTMFSFVDFCAKYRDVSTQTTHSYVEFRVPIYGEEQFVFDVVPVFKQ